MLLTMLLTDVVMPNATTPLEFTATITTTTYFYDYYYHYYYDYYYNYFYYSFYCWRRSPSPFGGLLLLLLTSL